MKKLLFVLVILCMGTGVKAQENVFDINFLIGAPQSDFRDNNDNTAIGIDASVAFMIPDSPLLFGVEGAIMTYGRDSRRENFNPNIPEVQIRVNTDYDIASGHLFLRYEGKNRSIKPYIDALVGFKYLFTESSIEDLDGFDEIASDTNFDDTAFSYGFGAGLKFLVSADESNRYYINVKTRYLFGGQAEYLLPGSISVNNGRLTFDISESSTDLLQIHVGFGVGF